MFDNKERKEARLNSYMTDTMSVQMYNLVMGLCILYGFIINAILVATAGPMMAEVNYIIFMIFYFVCAIAGSVISAKSSNPFISFIGYNLICVPVGLLLTTCLPGYSVDLIVRAAGATALVTAGMIGMSMVYPKFFEKIGGVLFFSLLIMIIVELLFLLFGLPIGWIDFVAVGIFSLYIGYDFHRAQMYPKTMDNAVDSAIDLYLDIINLFLRILSIMSDSND